MSLRGYQCQAALLVLTMGVSALSGCSFAASVPTNPVADVTQAFQTVAAALTPALPSPTLQSSPAPTSTPAAPAQTDEPPGPSPSGTMLPTGVLPCDLAAAGIPIDVTIPDETLLQPGESFVKIWRLQNAGSCTWTSEYTVAFYYGDRMDAHASAPLPQEVLPGQQVEIAIELVAPLAPGLYQGNWILSNPRGDLFGIGPAGDAPFWVRIVVAEPSSVTPTLPPLATASPTPSPSPNATSTPPVQVTEAVTLTIGSSLDLDSGQPDQGEQDDLLYLSDSSPYHWLAPQGEALLGVFGSQSPGQAGCQSASMSTAPIAVESLSVNVYLCYRTGEERLGQTLLVTVADDFTLRLEILTWANP